MLKTLTLHGYRSFESYRVADLAPVNLLVGKNNCGKTSILEAVELLVSGGSVSALQESARRRGELDPDGGGGADVSQAFHGRRRCPGARFELRDGERRVAAEILSLDDVGEAADRWEAGRSRRGADGDEEPAAVCGLRICSDERPPVLLPVSERGALLPPFWRRHARTEPSAGAVRFLGVAESAGQSESSMQADWNDAVAQRREAEVVESMRLLLPEIDSIHFLAGGRRPVVLIGERNRPRAPLASYGDAARRLLAITLALMGAENGCLLIDEIDTGFHWTVMDELWRLVLEAAQRHNVQVFATTHSYDCIRWLGGLVADRPELLERVAIHKVGRLLERAVCFAGEDIPIVVDQKIEVR